MIKERTADVRSVRLLVKVDVEIHEVAVLQGLEDMLAEFEEFAALVEIVRTHHDENVIIVSHKATIRLLLSSLLGFDPRRYRDNLDQSPAALNIIDFKDAAHARLTLFNSTSHYSATEHAIPSVPTARLSKWWSDAGK